IGGGIAGMEAGRWLAQRGHQVSLHEKSGQLGGQALLASLPPDKGEIQTLVDFLTRQVQKLGVDVHLNSEATAGFVTEQKPEAVVIATGGKQIQPRRISMDPKMKSIPAWAVLREKGKNLGSRVVVLGGGFVAAEITEFMAVHQLAEDFTMVEMREAIAFDMEPNFRQMLMGKLQALGIKMVTHCCIQQVTAAEVIGQDCRDGQTKRFPADTVVVALGTESVKFPVEAIQKAGVKVFTVGDAQEPHGIAEAVRSGYLAGTAVGQRSMIG
ncbi:MAG: FAD-dependent oxidoreductase, partial [Deltaproteobacteria bacterium]|nr:FAD-dependent oxidoreductase [Deltaproteobacteria bacterium]